jgi:hypothetical protein
MQAQGLAVEREAQRRLPILLGELLDEPIGPAEAGSIRGADVGVDFSIADDKGRIWIFEVKSWSRPGSVAEAARQLHRYAERIGDNAVPLLVVPYMSPASALAAEEAGISWLDLSGNAHIRHQNLYVNVRGHPNLYRSPGRPSSPFAPKSARVARTLLVEPERWWRQKDLVKATGLNDGNVSRIVRRLDEELLLERRGRELRPRDPRLLIDAWAEDYRFDQHDILRGHMTGSGVDLARTLAERLSMAGLHHAFTGLPAAWAIDHFAQFRLSSVYVDGDPHDIAERLEIRVGPRGANVQLIAPNDHGVFYGEESRDSLNCVSAVQAYLDLLHLPERAEDAARHLRLEYLRANGVQ